jgi:hypothetical protein
MYRELVAHGEILQLRFVLRERWQETWQWSKE